MCHRAVRRAGITISLGIQPGHSFSHKLSRSICARAEITSILEVATPTCHSMEERHPSWSPSRKIHANPELGLSRWLGRCLGWGNRGHGCRVLSLVILIYTWHSTCLINLSLSCEGLFSSGG
ncbi:hypothetical protein K469DRAFT_309482 [Zopfia rhizophila CBS 207.26]|uniref:Uncharacterized protein n=1 Tax=Zopfia rhizophila CBS 207.26 TaxID=1314779 RepID=A0A6A6EME0_9PEZI|nr:hypothetical protein K469DRAFT_309482 [Zopfia rhizophila CBS 207.26]